MGGPGQRKAGDDLAPVFRLLIDGETPLSTDITDFISSVEFESAVDMSDLMQITISNPFDVAPGAAGSPPDWTQHKAVQPGQEVELWGGYGNPDTFIGRAILTKHLPNYPQDGIPSLVVKGYDLSYLMMNAAGPLSMAENRVTLTEPRPLDQKDVIGESFVNITPANAVRRIASKYGFMLDVDDNDNTGNALIPTSFLQRKGVSDFEICRMLANLNRKEMWVDYDRTQGDEIHPGSWTFHWRKPRDQEHPKYIFQYGNGNLTSLLSFSCEYGLKDTLTAVILLAWDPAGQRWISAADIEDVSGESPKWKPGAGVQQRTKPGKVQVANDGVSVKTRGLAKKQAKEQRNVVTADPDMMNAVLNATEFRLAAGGVAIDLRTEVPFTSLQDAANYAIRWLLTNKDNFLVAHGTLIGVETLRAGQVQAFDGLGDRLSGNYYLISVRHKFSAAAGYTCDFTARLVIE